MGHVCVLGIEALLDFLVGFNDCGEGVDALDQLCHSTVKSVKVWGEGGRGWGGRGRQRLAHLCRVDG